MSRKNEIVAKDVSERKALWAAVRRAEPIQEIRRLMRQKEILNKDMAVRLGVTEAAVSRLLRGDQNIQIDTLHMLADALEETLSISIGEEGSGHTYAFEGDDNWGSFDFVSCVEGEDSNVIHLNQYRKNEQPAYNSFDIKLDLDSDLEPELECA